jgi:uncharacterized protein (DUF885 family)
MMRKRCLIFMVLLVSMGAWIVACRPSPTAVPNVEQGTAPPLSIEVPTPTDQIPPVPERTGQLVEETEPAPPEAPSHVDVLASEMEGLSLRDFFEASNRALALRSPETVLGNGLTEFYGVTDVNIDDISTHYQQETYALMAAILTLLEGYDRSELSPEDQISYDVYRWYLQDQLASQEFMYHDYPATYYPITAVHEDLLYFFTDIHPIREMQDARDYVTRLEQIGKKIDQLIEGLEDRNQRGIEPPQFAIQWSVYGSLGQFINTPARENRLYTVLKEKIGPLSSGTPEDYQLILEDAERTINEVVLPAYRKLHSYLGSLKTYTGDDSGIWRLPQGGAYYDYLLRHFTTTDISVEEIHQKGLVELERIHAEMRVVFEQLGFPQDITIVQAYNHIAQNGGHVSGNDVITTYEKLITEADQNLDPAFDIHPKAELIVIPDPYGDFYVHGSFDGSRPGAFYAGVDASGRDYYAMPTLAYHETIPGHHFQISLAMEMDDLPSFRRGLIFTAYAEGWALYAENLAWELGWYEGDPYGYLGLLQGQAFRAARLVVDTGLHAEGWTFDQAQDFFTANTGFEVGDNVNPQYEIARYLVWPGQSVAYYVGFQKFLELRQRAMDELGEAFDLKTFHRVVLGNGSIPLELLEQMVDQYIAGEIEP